MNFLPTCTARWYFFVSLRPHFLYCGGWDGSRLPCQALGSHRTCFHRLWKRYRCSGGSVPQLTCSAGGFSTKLKQINRKAPGDRLSRSPTPCHSNVLHSSVFCQRTWRYSDFLFHCRHKPSSLSLLLLWGGPKSSLVSKCWLQLCQFNAQHGDGGVRGAHSHAKDDYYHSF